MFICNKVDTIKEAMNMIAGQKNRIDSHDDDDDGGGSTRTTKKTEKSRSMRGKEQLLTRERLFSIS